LGNHFHFFGPNNPKCRIIPPHSPGRFHMVEFRDLIENFSVVFQSQKAVGTSLWYVMQPVPTQPQSMESMQMLPAQSLWNLRFTTPGIPSWQCGDKQIR